MVSLFDIEKLTSLIRDFYQITNIRTTVFDENLNELVSYPRRVAPYCEVIRSSHCGLEACVSSDRNACRVAAEKRGTVVYRCHAGFTEAVTPLFIGDILVGYLLFGHVFSYASPEDGWNAVEKNTRSLQVNKQILKDAVMDAKYMPEETVRSAAHILRAVASYLILEHMASLRQDRIAVKLDSYLTSHFAEKINVNSLCDALHIGKTQLYKLSHQLYGCGITQRIRFLRIALAKKLLADPENYTLSEISDRCGYGDYNYFIAVFSKETGCAPNAWRKFRQEEKASAGLADPH